MISLVGNQSFTYECYLPHYVKRRIASHVCHDPHRLMEGNEKVFATLLFADISGFTRLASLLNAEDLKYYINDYFSIMLDIIDKFGGDVMKFCGDAVIIMWYAPLCSSSHERELCTLKAGFCALQLIESCGNYKKPLLGKEGNGGFLAAASFLHTDSNTTCSLPTTFASHETSGKNSLVELSLHCGISSGIVSCMILGNDQRREFIICGSALENMGKAESIACKNQVGVTMDCKIILEKYLELEAVHTPSEFPLFLLKAQLNQFSSKVKTDKGCGKLDASSTRQNRIHSIMGLNVPLLTTNAVSHPNKYIFSHKSENIKDQNANVDLLDNKQMSMADMLYFCSRSDDILLQAVLKRDNLSVDCDTDYQQANGSMQFQTLIRSFVHQTALSAVESNTFALLSEMRTVVTVFVSLQGLESVLERGEFDKVQEVFLLLLSTLDLHSGSLRQFVVDDKGCVAIVCFGLFGCNTSNNPLNALKFSVDLQQLLQQKQLSLCGGITVGRVYCGNVGSISRCEFSVMGSSVNLAARLMCACKTNSQFIMVTGDIRTATVTSHEFVQMSSIIAKGYDHPICVYAPLIAKRSFGRAVILNSKSTLIPSSSHDDNQTTMNKFLKTIHELNESYVQQLRPEGAEVESKSTTNKVQFDFVESKFFPPEVEKTILSLRDLVRSPREVDQVGKCSFTLLCGTPGSGKTTLLQRLCYDLLDQQFRKTKIIFVNSSLTIQNRDMKEPYSLIREFLRFLVWDQAADSSSSMMSRFEAAALKVESYSHSSSDVVLDIDDFPDDAAVKSIEVSKCMSDSGLMKNPITSNTKESNRRRTMHVPTFESEVQQDKLSMTSRQFRRQDLGVFTAVQAICESFFLTSVEFSTFVTHNDFDQKSTLEYINQISGVIHPKSAYFVNNLLQIVFGSCNLVDFIYSYLHGSLCFDFSYTQIIDRIFIMVLLILFGMLPREFSESASPLPRLIALIDDIDCADASSLRILSEVMKLLRSRVSSNNDGVMGALVMTWTLEESLSNPVPGCTEAHQNNGDFNIVMTRRLIGRSKDALNTRNSIFQLFEEECHQVLNLENLSTASIQGLLHTTLGERRWEWLLRKGSGLLKHENIATFGRRHAFVAEHLSQVDASQDVNHFKEREILRKSSNQIVGEIFNITNSGSPTMVYEILASLRHAIDHGIFTSIRDLPVLKQRKELVLEWLDGLNGSELAILKAASVVGEKFSAELLRKGLMSLDMEYCCADMVLNSALLRLRRIGILRKLSDAVSVTNCSFKCDLFQTDDNDDIRDSHQYEFVDDSIRVAIYNLMLDSQKSAVHSAVASYYELSCPSSKVYSRWYPIFHHYMKSGAVDKMTEYSLKLLQYNVSVHRYFDVVQICSVLLNLLGASKERVLIKQAAHVFEKQLDKVPHFLFQPKQPISNQKSILLIAHASKRIVRLYNAMPTQDILDSLNNLFTWTVKQPSLSFPLLSSSIDVPSKRSKRRSTVSVRSSYWSSGGRTNRVAADESTEIDKEVKEELRQIDYRSGLVHHFSKGLVAHHLFSSSWETVRIVSKSPSMSFLPIKFSFKTEILDLIMLASLIEQLSHAYLCLGHSTKSEDCSALSLCLLQHSRNLDQERKKLKKMLSVDLPPNESQINNEFPSELEQEVEVKCILKLALLGVFRGDIASVMVLLHIKGINSVLKENIFSWCLRITGQNPGNDKIKSKDPRNLDCGGNLSSRTYVEDSNDEGCSGKGALRNHWNESDSNCMYCEFFQGLNCISTLNLTDALMHLKDCGHYCELLTNMTMKLVSSVFLVWCYVLQGNFNAADSVITDVKFPMILKRASGAMNVVISGSTGSKGEEVNLSKSCSFEIANLQHLVATFKTIFVTPNVMGRLRPPHETATPTPGAAVSSNSALNLLRGCIGHHEWSSQCYDMFRIVMEPSSDLEEALLTTKTTLPLLAYYLGGKYPLQLVENANMKQALVAFYFRHFSRPMILICESEKDYSEYYGGSHDYGSSFFPTSPLFHIVAFMIIFASCRLLHHQIEMVNSNQQTTFSSRSKARKSSWYEDLEAINIETFVTIMFALASFDKACTRSFPILKSLSLVLHVQLQLLLHSVRDHKMHAFLTRSVLPLLLQLPVGIQLPHWNSESGLFPFLKRFYKYSSKASQKYTQCNGCSYSIDFLRHLGDFLDINTFSSSDIKIDRSFRLGETADMSEKHIHDKQPDDNAWFGKWMVQWQYEDLQHLLHNTDSTS